MLSPSTGSGQAFRSTSLSKHANRDSQQPAIVDIRRPGVSRRSNEGQDCSAPPERVAGAGVLVLRRESLCGNSANMIWRGYWNILTRTDVPMTYDRQCWVSGWVVSGLLHLGAISMAAIFVTEVKPPTAPTPFHWEVALVDAVTRSDSTRPIAVPDELTPSSGEVQQRAAPQPTVVAKQVRRTIEPDRYDRRERIERQVQPVVQQAEAIQEVTRQAIQPVPERPLANEPQPVPERTPMRSADPVQAAAEPVAMEPVSKDLATAIDRTESTPAAVSATPMEVAHEVVTHNAVESVTSPGQTVVERAAPVVPTAAVVDAVESAVSRSVTEVPAAVRPEVNPTAFVMTIEPAPAPSEPRSTAVPQPAAATPPHPATASVPATPEPQASNAEPEATKAAAVDPREEVRQEVDQVVARSAMAQPAPKTDYRWLAESLYRRVAELKRYPNAARLNGWEGKVVLRAIIKADGNLADLRIQKSSGFDALDEAALETVRQACPLYLKHALGRPEVVVSLPIVYSLSK